MVINNTASLRKYKRTLGYCHPEGRIYVLRFLFYVGVRSITLVYVQGSAAISENYSL